MEIHHNLVNDPAFSKGDIDTDDENEDAMEAMKKKIEKKVIEIMEKLSIRLTKGDTDDVIQSVIDETMGLGPLEQLTYDESITEIMTNGASMVFIEQKGKVKLSDIIFHDEDHLRRVITKIASKVGRRIDETSPLVDARLMDGSRVNAVIPPIAVNGSALTIRKFNKNPLRTGDLMKFDSFTPPMEEFMRICVRSKLNCIVSGGTGSGKTTLLNALSSFIPSNERIITIEDSAELQLIQDHIVGLETRPANLEGKGEISIRDLVKNAMRMRPDRLVVGEVRSGEALDMLQAMNTGNDGSMTTAHANTPKDLVARIETMVLMAGLELPVRAIRQQTSAAFDLIIQQSRLQDGTRKITNITEVLGMEEDTILIQDIFVFHQTGIDPKTKKVQGFFTATGIRPSFADTKISSKGYTFKPDFFKPDPRYSANGTLKQKGKK